jgi:phosphatidylcholine synthase
MSTVSAAINMRELRSRQALAWCVHFYTALGLVAAAAITVLLVQGGADAFRGSFALMLVATVIDATDGTLARRVRVKEVLPGFDGRRLDDLVDFLTYTCLPLFLIWRAAVLPSGLSFLLVVPLLASAYGFSQVAAKTEDGFFLGFPSYWNLVAFYVYVLRMPPWLALAMVLLFSLLTFVPSRYLYPTQRGLLNGVTNLFGVIWIGLFVWILSIMPDQDGFAEPERASPVRLLALWSLLFPAYYMAASWTVSVRYWLRRPRHTASFPK